MNLSRRQFLTRGLYLSAGLSFFPWGKSVRVADAAPSDPHFFLQILPTFPAGWDCSYLFDARPLEMTQKGLIQNYTNSEPKPWVGKNGTATLATSLVQPLQSYRDYFSVLNGVYMSTLDGHDQNINYLLTGDAFGGDGFIPIINQSGSGHCVLDAIQRGQLGGSSVDNTAATIPFGVPAARNFVKSLKVADSVDPSSALSRYLAGRFQGLGQGQSSFSLGASEMGNAFAASPSLVTQMKQLKIGDTDPDDELGFAGLATQMFRLGVARSAILCLGSNKVNFDTHDPMSAKAQPKNFADLTSTLAGVLKLFRETPYDSKRSLMDVTTFIISAEFSRTLRQFGKPIDQTGTDHNPSNNSVLVGGKGIQGGLVIGASDFRSSTETLSKAHLAADPGRFRMMGKPFDFSKSIPTDQLPASFDADLYLSFNSVINTVYSLFGIDSSQYRLVERNGAKAPVLNSLLS